MEREIKSLKWRNNATEIGMAKGLFSIVADAPVFDIRYSISNHKKMWIPDKPEILYYLRIEDSNKQIECNSVKEAKQKAQEHFEKRVLKSFFKK